MKFREAKTDYLNHIRFEAMLAKTTSQSYQAGLNRYGNWLTDQGYGDAEIVGEVTGAIACLEKSAQAF